ncbi:MAG: midcut-by-XrtH protein [Gallionellaceae bacterium]
MVQHTRKFIGILSTLTLMLVCSDAVAGTAGGGTIVYSPYAQAIPTLSGAMLVVLAFLFAVLAFRALRAHPGGKPLAALLALGVLVLVAASGNQLIRNAQAIVGFFFSNPGGGIVSVLGNAEYPVQNTSGRPQQIVSVNPISPSVALPTSGSPQCTVGLVVPNSNACYVFFGLPPE